ncbi:MAG TPA: IPT/TIG domain-containing protein [Bryobacteraceae bacterium]|nr:IPT/TIG domain-containing protein [Bryobacteraceae bacterium]
MPADITNVAPPAANPGDQITLTGTGFVAGASVVFAGNSLNIPDAAAQVKSATQILTTVPDFGGDALALSITVTNPGDTPSNAAGLNLNAWPPVETTFPMCGLGALKRSLGLAPDENDMDDQLRELILTASAQLARIVTYDIQPVTITGELYDGNNGTSLYLTHAPIVSVSACSIDGQAADVSSIKVYPEYIAFDDSLEFEYLPRLRAGSQIFGFGRQNVSVDYIAGFPAVPGDLARACMIQVGFLRNTLGKQGIVSDTNSVVNATTQYSQLPLAPAARIAANRYRKQGVRAV